MKIKLHFFLIFFLSSYLMAFAQLKPAQILSDNMVLQRNMPIPVWGKAQPNEKITVTFNQKKYSTKANAQGKWMVKMEALPASEKSYQMDIQGAKNKVSFKNILMGDVWICSGQSNMEWTVENSNDANTEIANAQHPQIRLFQVKKRVALKPEADLQDEVWKVCEPQNVAKFSAVGYFFGRELHQKYKVPMGLIDCSWGGTNAETWISKPAIVKNAEEYAATMQTLDALDMKVISEQRKAKLKALIGEIPENDLGLVGDKAVWADPAMDVTTWKSMNIPQLWENAGLEQLDGIVWFRKELELTEEQAQKGVILNIGKVDDSDITWVNGVKVGETLDKYDALRRYVIEPKVLKAGKNIIAVRVEDYRGGGGLWGTAEEFYAQVNTTNTKIPLAGDWKYKVSKAILGDAVLEPNTYPTLLFNGMISPIIPYSIKGAIWYQGESNVGRAHRYQHIFPLLIKDWREQWQQGDFPFFWVQLANYQKAPANPTESAWAELREAQTTTLSVPNTGMALAIDIGEADDIHPRNKQDVGRRLALAAQKVVYGDNIVHSGPQYKSMKIEGKEIRIDFELFGSKLMVKDRYGYLKGFAVASSDKKFYWAKARLEGNQVVVWSEQVPNPVAVRYAWADNPDDVNLYNEVGLPALPFRTDVWEGVTFGRK
jgi:sialate O-acetylesterase